jgi:hypothetical protein
MNRHVETIFCDDIRQEIGGKISYIGVYSAKMLVSSFPATLSKFCIALRVVTSAAQPFHKVSIRVLKNDETLAEGEIGEQELASFVEGDNDTPDIDRKDRVQGINMLFVFSPFKLDGPCTLRVRVGTESEEYRGIGLVIQQAPAQLRTQ